MKRMGKWCAALIAAVGLCRCGVAPAALVHEWRFEENSTGATVLDSVGTLHGTPSGSAAAGNPVYVPGLYQGSNYAMLFNSNGTTGDQTLAQKVTLPSNATYIRNTPGATLAAWVRADAFANQTRTIISISNADATGNGGSGNARATIQVSSNRFRALGRQADTGGSSNATAPAAQTVTAGQTYFVVGVFDYANQAIRLYVDGALSASATVAGWTLGGNVADTASLTATLGSISAPSAGNQEFWPGVIDGVRIYDTALTADDVAGIYRAELLPEPGVVGLVVAGAGVVLARRRR